ncbi:hypothetical protein MGYG_07303 [Nannizzia gypsea CBS 118893]|uniref:Lysine-specific metallo-endopeptidase domain-containing protein n=1 Tax=Arthroderma gypseum (strain ATCC MYA-4604 / CBS 118893) TaxID=535722 RepID=E4V2S2_ARTGP|nr:hypothetical protein MGYG_07303 [Nannizzia gypsea CBS 118893]EFR04296.1 hypothetical protein MGYG_07303 [Nannizzia gypsea CBS 118893]
MFYLLEMLDELIKNLNDGDLDFWCDDSLLSLTAPPDASPHGDVEPGHTFFWDTRDASDEGQCWVDYPGRACQDNVQGFNMRGVQRDTIVLCPKLFRDSAALGEFKVDMTSRPPMFSRGVHIDKFSNSLMFVLIHELSHCVHLLGDLWTDDVPGTRDGYGWAEAIHHGRNNHLNALANAAMFLSENDWCEGVANDMFDDGVIG